ncbi:P-loop containing nucleoside triphosphate hydrolase protein [Amylocarpus encephaloides]|uniref:P-loop containing nucleoside triphosphate hydrolase protein n=1 Tax=Amylocarpus encephaloides TaxID=45428 RepID=A0A9P7YLP1_9HELO|nr:P-loop containing nucleoside triphosphate hydrolase protein [Amylocarpus encephaloides]
MATLAPRTRPMKIMVLGLCRTGTMSMKTALESLGYNTYHMVTVFKYPDHAPKWVRLMKDKYEGDGKMLTREMFDDILGDFDALTDVPPASFVPELIAAYPEAKIILSKRNAESWVNSMMQTIYSSRTPNERLNLHPNLQLIDDYINLMFKHQCHDDFPRYGVQSFDEHCQLVRKHAPTENLLEFEAKDGWVPLCEFLGHKVPEGDYPRTNDWMSFRARLEMAGAEIESEAKGE